MNDVCNVMKESQRIFKIDSYRRIRYVIAVNRVLAWETNYAKKCFVRTFLQSSLPLITSP